MVDLGFLDTTQTPDGLDDFRAGYPAGDTVFDLDASFALQLGVRLRVGKTIDFYPLMMNAWWRGADDHFAEPEKRRQITYDDRLLLGFSVGVGRGF